jgi:hypothetical protein
MNKASSFKGKILAIAFLGGVGIFLSQGPDVFARIRNPVAGDIERKALLRTSILPLQRTPILGFDAVPGEIFLEFHRDEIETQLSRGERGAVLAEYSLTNSGDTGIELNDPRFYAMADKPFILSENVDGEVLRASTSQYPIYRTGVFVGNAVEFPGWFTIPAHETVVLYIEGDLASAGPVGALELEPDFTAPGFSINYVDDMGNDKPLAPFNLTGGVQSLQLAAMAGGVNASTADNARYAQYYEGVVGTLTSPYLPEGAIMRNRAGIDVYIVKYNNGKRFKRVILSPSVFRSYRHLKWENVLITDDTVMNSYATSSYAFVAGSSTVWRLDPAGDTGMRKKLLLNEMNRPLASIGYDPDGVYEINAVDRDSYGEGPALNLLMAGG